MTLPAFCYDSLDNYFASMAELAPLDCYDSLAHVIYPCAICAAGTGRT